MRHNDLLRWPTFLDSSSALTALDLSHNLIRFGDASPENTPSSITEFVSTLIFGRQSTPQQGPPQLDKIMPSLTYLDLSDNRIVTFPIDILKQIPTLLKLKLRKNEISQQVTDNAMDGVFELVLLDLSNCNISTLYIPRLPKLQTLILDGNSSLSIISQDMIDRFNNLVELCISDTGIDYPQLERLMDHLPLLQKLCANKTRIAGTVTLRSPKLRVLELSNNRITRVLVDGDQQDFQMSALNMSNNQIEYIDDRVSSFTELTTLNLSNNHLDTCPNVGSMRHLVDLRLDNNRIQTITSEQLQDCRKLRKLTMSHNRLVHVPDRIALLSELEELDLSHNKIRDYALVTASQLTCLETLNLEYNYLSSVVQNDCDISTLVSLQVLQIAHNEITSLPNGIYVLQNLKKLTMDQNSQSLYNAASADANFLRWQDRYLVKVECSLHVPSQISETLYLSSEMAASNRLLLSQLGITHILTIGDDKTLSRHLDDDTEEFTCMRLPLSNSNSAQIQPLFDRAFRFIDQARHQGGVCLVHGFAGHNRSASIVIAYLMFTELLTYDQALEKVTSVRENIRISPLLVKQIQIWDKERK
jgi:Leucine-rich repeat (LRR) protein